MNLTCELMRVHAGGDVNLKVNDVFQQSKQLNKKFKSFCLIVNPKQTFIHTQTKSMNHTKHSVQNIKEMCEKFLSP